MDQAARRAQTSKGGPRVLTVTPTVTSTTVDAAVVNNCPKCDPPDGVAIWGEDGELGEYALLVHGWYVLETDIQIFWQQVNPSKACSTDPLLTGRKLNSGSCVAFFVDQSTIDGVIVVAVCDQDFPDGICGEAADPFVPEDFTQGLIRISRADTVLTMAESDGDNATLTVPPPSGVCG